MRFKKTTLCVLSVLSLTLVTACGVKPGHVKAPAGVKDTYPTQYPAPEPMQ